MPKMRLRRQLTIGFGILVIAALAGFTDLFVFFPHRAGAGNGDPREIKVTSGIGPKRLARKLNEARIVSSPQRFALWLRFTGGLTELKAGRFRIADNATPIEILEILSGRGIDLGLRVTIPEGYTLTKIGETLERAGLISKIEFIAAGTDSGVLKRLGIPGPIAEGYLFPDTYYFDETKSLLAEDAIEIMHTNFKERIGTIKKIRPSKLKRVVTLASIVQAEARVADEMPVIAGVYNNRLTKSEFPSRLLQADPTVSYGCEPYVRPRAKSCISFRGTLTRAQLNDDGNPYNTYRHAGLPPGPICAPGLGALEAAANPKAVPYFYFVVKAGGRHTFSKTLAEHQRAVEQYRNRN